MVYYKDVKNNDTLSHSGIFGMKWGRRRYRNYDGTLTEEGKTRYRESSEDQKTYDKNRKKSYKELTNKELSDLNTRKKLIDEYKQNNPKNPITKGYKKFDGTIGETVRDITAVVLTIGAGYALYETGKSIIDRFQGKTDSNGNRVGIKWPKDQKKKK